MDFGAETFFHFLAGNILSMEGVLCLSKLSLQRSDLCLETLDNLLGMLGCTRRFSFCLLDRQFQAGDLLRQDISVGLEIVDFGISTFQSFFFLLHHTL